MGKLVVLKLDGDLETRGFTVTLEIGEEGSRAEIEKSGGLPSSPELAAALQQHWQEKYRNIGAPYRTQSYRIRPQEIIYDGFVNNRIGECCKSAENLRSLMMAWLRSESFRDIDTCLREELNRDEHIRFLIRTDDKHLHKLPWHLWDFFDRYSKAEVALSANCAKNKKRAVAKPQSTVRILAILGHSEGIDIDADRQLLENLPNAETVFLVEPNRKAINDQLWEQPWDIIFFAGHSETEGETGKIYINKTESLTINELWYALRHAVDRGLKLAIFNSCDGLGVARQLDDLQIPQMIVMRELVPDQVAQEFLKNFLTAFAGGQSLYLAVRQARERLQGLENKFPCATWLPTICQNLAEAPPAWEDWLEKPKLIPVAKPNLRGRALGHLVLTSVVVTSLVMGVRSLGWLHSWELNAFDRMMRLRPNEKRDERLLIVEVTKDDIERLKDKYPLSDLMMLRLLKKLEQHKPQVIGLDIYRDMPEGKGRAELIQYFQKSDRAIAPCVHPEGKNPGIEPPTGIKENKLGFLDVMRDDDGTIRRHLLALDPPDKSPCSANYALSSQLALHYLASKGYSLKFPTASTWKIGPLSFERLKQYTGFYQEPEMTGGHQIMLNYRSYNSVEDIAKRVTLTQVMTDRVNPNLIGGRIVLIGVTDPTLAKDDFSTPYNQEIRGLVLHAQMVSQLVSAIEDRRPLLSFWPFWADVIWIGVWSFVGGAIALSFKSLLYRGMTIAVAVIIICGICFIFLLEKGVLVPFVPSALALLITGSIVVTNNTYQKQQ
jgi:CHASE2 domain-containing sensor protein